MTVLTDGDSGLQGDEIGASGDRHALRRSRIIQPDDQVGCASAGICMKSQRVFIDDVFACAPAGSGTTAVSWQRWLGQLSRPATA